MTIQTSEDRRRGCAFTNLSNETIPPYACMMLVAPDGRRLRTASPIVKKATGVKFFGQDVDNEFGVYVDKCDLWGQLIQDPSRFVFNGDISVPPNGVGYCSFGEYPVRTWLTPGLSPFRTDIWDGCFFAPVRDSWYLSASSPQGAFKFFGIGSDNTHLVYVTPNPHSGLFYAVWGTFQGEGISLCGLSVTGDSFPWDVFSGGAASEMFSYTRPVNVVTINLPGIYVMQWKGTAYVKDPDTADTTIPFSYEVETSAADGRYSQESGDGILKKVSDGYAAYWPGVDFSGVIQIAVTDAPVTVKIRQTLTEKVQASGNWRIVWDRDKTARSVGWIDQPVVDFGYPWWIWENTPRL